MQIAAVLCLFLPLKTLGRRVLYLLAALPK